MSYIYDILLNFNYEVYDFYEWNKNDSIIHIKKIPIFKIDKDKFRKIILNDISFDSNFLKKVINKTEVYSKRSNLKYAFLLTDGLDIIAINISNKIKYSKLLLDEEIDILNITNKLNIYDINFNIISKGKIDYKTRHEKEISKKFVKVIEKINNPDELKYLYYDCFNEKCNNIILIKERLNKNIENHHIIKKINDYFNIKKS